MRWKIALAFAPLAASAAAFGPRITDGGDVGWGVPHAEASVSILMSLEELVAASDAVVVGRVLERTSRWEEVGGSRRIVTLTKVSIEERIAGKTGDEITVRTLGGVVGDIGQAVAGEAQLAVGTRALLFVAPIDGVHVAVGRAQGHFVVVDDEDAGTVLRPSPEAGTLLPRPGPSVSARERLVDAELGDAQTMILEAKKRVDARDEE